ncbi:MAG: asparagine synthase (glutamine-hydrolyzing) [Alphaproteobacteria bacterium]
MCGITGFIDQAASMPGGVLDNTVGAMADRLQHRGPDDRGVWSDQESGIALGFRRLAIIDLTQTGHQPMLSADGRFVIVFNGEIYNFRELRTELKDLGRQFRGGSDTEVMLEGFCEWGVEETLRKLIGMFAIALWDRRERRLWLARDRLGIKPLYYAREGNLFLFGSELKALHAHPDWQPKLDRNALGQYLRYNYVPEPATIFRATRKLPPGTLLRLDAGAAEPVISRYWDFRAVVGQPRIDRSDADAVAEAETLLVDAVSRRMVADVPLGALLSGGIDSSLVTALMQAASDKPVRTFTVGFDTDGYNEARAAAAVARHLGTEHTEMMLSPETARDLIPDLPYYFDEPFADSSALPTWLVSRMARDHVTVALSGDGGDETFFGYNRYRAAPALWEKAQRLPGFARKAGGAILETVPTAAWDGLAGLLPKSRRPQLAGDKAHKLARLAGAASPDDVYLSLVSHWQAAERMAGGGEPAALPFTPADLPDFTERMAACDTMTYLPGDILTKVDRASMATSLEARVPLLDHRVVEFAWSLPQHQKIRNGNGKWILRQVLGRHVPAALTDRPKAGFAVPLAAWLRGPVRDWAAALLDPARLKGQGWIDPAPVASAWREHLDGKGNHAEPLWNICMLQAWADRWKVD